MRIQREMTQSVADHEVLVSFDNDSEAPMFEEWLRKYGFNLYKQWLQECPCDTCVCGAKEN